MSVEATYRHKLDAPLADAWSVVGDFGSLLKWVSGGEEGKISLTGDGPGMLRDFILPAVGAVQHRLDVLDDQQHQLTYSLTSGKPLGMVEYSVSIRLTEAGGDACTMNWSGEFTAEPDAAVEGMAQALKDAYRSMSELLNELLKDKE
ncbi:MAG: SRPBCC family protein [Gammaproteobacteria bacterium]|nr:SRPBCC family protein [Gammaproteobacteria bacterium]